MKRLPLSIALICLAFAAIAGQPLFDMAEMHDETTLNPKVISNWKTVDFGDVKSRQKVVEITVGKLGTGEILRAPVRFVVPETNKARGFHLTGDFGPKNARHDHKVSGIDAVLIKHNVGLVMTTVSAGYPSPVAQKRWNEHFTKTLNPRSSTGFWIWPATLMRAITAAYAEKDYFEKGKIAMSGRSKHGASPTVVLIVDKRTTALHASASPICESPARLFDEQTLRKIDAYQASHRPPRISRAQREAAKAANKARKAQHRRKGKPSAPPPASTKPLDQVVSPKPYDRSALGELKSVGHFAMGGTFGLNFSKRALGSGRTWEELRRFANEMAPNVFVSLNLKQLTERNVDMLFHPGTHDYICWDIYSCGKNYPTIPIYLRVNSAHASKDKRNIDPNENNKNAFLYHHFIGGEPLLSPPTIKCAVDGRQLTVTVKFPPGSKEETGDLYWMYDRAPEGTDDYLRVKFPQEHTRAMTKAGDVWTATIKLKNGQSSIDLFTTHRKTIKCGSETYSTYLSSPYTRVDFQLKK